MIIKKIESTSNNWYLNFSLDIDFKKLNIFVGDNGSGKSNIASALAGEAQKILNKIPWQKNVIDIHISHLGESLRDVIYPEALMDDFVLRGEWIESLKFPLRAYANSNSYKENVLFVSMDGFPGSGGIDNMANVDEFLNKFLFSNIKYIEGNLYFPKLDMLRDFGNAIGFLNIVKIADLIMDEAKLQKDVGGKIDLPIDNRFFSNAEKVVAYIFGMIIQKKPKILILDDVDAVLHPKIKSNFNILISEIRRINPNDMQIFVFTNSSTTYEYLDKNSSQLFLTKRIDGKFSVEKEANGCRNYSSAKLKYEIFGVINDDYFMELYQQIENVVKVEQRIKGKITVAAVDKFLLTRNARLYNGVVGSDKTMICNIRNHVHHRADSARIISRQDVGEGIDFMKNIINTL